jgi:SAM-dependent methyltransferase
MVKARVYDWMYRIWAPWDSVGVRRGLRTLVEIGVIYPASYPRTIDLGCGTGANVVYLAKQGFESHGVDFSEAAIAKARRRAEEAGVEVNLVVGDLTAPSIEGVEGPYDFLLDFGTLDDLRGEAREKMAATVTRLSRPGSRYLEYCFYGITEELPRFSFKGPSRFSHIAPGELEDLYGESWDIEKLSEDAEWRVATFLLTRR